MKNNVAILAPAGPLRHGQTVAPSTHHRPRLGFLGTGWIGRMRLQSLLETGIADCAAVCDTSAEAAAAAADLTGGATVAGSLAELLAADLDGLVIASPSALHAEQCLLALARGQAVFCQKPLARTAAETRQVVEAARAADRLLGIDFSYRHLAGMDRLRSEMQDGLLGEIFAADLIFHNAYGPDKAWFYDVSAAGGGCVMDLGIHLVDLALWLLGPGKVAGVTSRLMAGGVPLQPPYETVEAYATAEFSLNGCHLRLCCSWNLHAGRDAVIEAHFHGTRGGAALTNVAGSFYDFEITRFTGTAHTRLAGYPDAWGGRALLGWAARLAADKSFDPEVAQAVQVAEVIDRIYRR